MKTVFLFAGQGSQFFGMARPLFAENPTFRDELRNLDDIVRGLIGHSIIDVLYSSKHLPGEPFDRTLFTHPAVFMIEVALARALGREGVVPDIVVGSSLGELAALVVAGALTAEDALEACVIQAETFEARCPPGGMVAILADPRIFEEQDWLFRESTIAGVNLAQHFVVTAPAARCDEIVRHIGASETGCHRLPVRVAFHSSAIDTARDEFLARVARTPFAPPKVPVLSSARAGMLTAASPAFLWEMARAPMRFREVLAVMARLLPCRFVDLSPGATLGTFVKHHFSPEQRPESLAIVTRFGTDMQSFTHVVARNRVRTAHG